MTKNILVIDAHPDDEILGCGATMARHIKEGDHVRVLIMAEGLTSRQDIRQRDAVADEMDDLHQACLDANKTLGVTDVAFHNFPDNRMDSVDLLDVVKVIEKEAQAFQPDIVYCHHGGDVNIDHRIINMATITAFRPQPNSKACNIYFFEVTSSTEWNMTSSEHFVAFNPNHFVDVSDYYSFKKQALAIYKSEMREYPHARSIEGTAARDKWRGASVGLEYAEAFILGRSIVK